MAVYIGSARGDERGYAAGGASGDQKQYTTPDYRGEVSMEKFYVHSKGWVILRAKRADVAMGLAASMIQACNNKNIGYDQNQRLGVTQHGTWSAVRTECDCSSLVRQCIREATYAANCFVDIGNFTTANEASVVMATGLFDRFNYVSGMTLYTGDILVTKTKGHTVIVTVGAARVSNVYPVYSGNSNSIVAALHAVGETDASFSKRSLIASANNIANYTGTAEQNIQMVNMLKAGQLKRAESANYYPVYQGTTTSIVAALRAVGEADTSYDHRAKIARTNNILNYSGAATQNTTMLNLLKLGQLKKA